MGAENEGKWYVIHTYSGYENKVLDSIQKMVVNAGLQDYIFDVKIPVEEVMEVKNERRKVVQHKLFPSYVMIKMIMTKRTMYLIRNTRGVTGFVGPGSKPVPLTDEEVDKMGIEQQTIILNYGVGDSVKIKDGPLENFVGIVDEISMEKRKVKVVVSMFGRETPVELDFNLVENV